MRLASTLVVLSISRYPALGLVGRDLPMPPLDWAWFKSCLLLHMAMSRLDVPDECNKHGHHHAIRPSPAAEDEAVKLPAQALLALNCSPVLLGSTGLGLTTQATMPPRQELERFRETYRLM